MTLRIANAAGFWGDDISAPRRLVENATVDFLTLEYLAELTMSILAHLKSKDPNAGFATDIVTVMQDIATPLRDQTQLRVVTNAGGMNPIACAQAVARVLADTEMGDESVAIVQGDDLLPRITQLQADGCRFENLETGQPLSELQAPIASANAYLGAAPIADALDGGARIVVTGRVADASLTLGPLVHRYRWPWNHWDLLAAGTVAGHVIECGAQATGGYSDRWRDINYVDMGYPIAEVEANGVTTITKPANSGGIVDRRSVSEQLLYEIGDPAAYYTPDVVADFTNLEARETAPDRVQIVGARGKPAPDSLKVSLAYRAGYTATAQLLVVGDQAHEKGKFVGELILQRLAKRGIALERTHIECLGGGKSGQVKNRDDSREVMLRISVRDSNRASVERFTYEIAPVITNGPNGIAGYAAGRPAVRPVLAYWPTLVPKALVPSTIEVRAAKEWIARS